MMSLLPNPDWLKFDGGDGPVHELLSSIETSAMSRVADLDLSDPQQMLECLVIAQALDEVHVCAAGRHETGTNKFQGYADLVGAKDGAEGATTPEAWLEVLAGLRHGHT